MLWSLMKKDQTTQSVRKCCRLLATYYFLGTDLQFNLIKLSQWNYELTNSTNSQFADEEMSQEKWH